MKWLNLENILKIGVYREIKGIRGLLVVLLVQISVLSLAGQGLIRTPVLSPDGTSLALGYNGDIWVVPSIGGEAVRLTVHPAYDASPQWSPDGRKLVFVSNRYHHSDLFTIPLKSGGVRRLTFHTNGSRSPSWGKEGILFETTRVRQEIEWEREIYQLSPEGGTPTRAINAFGYRPKASPSGRYIAFEKGPCKIEREKYRGSANKDIWIYDTKLDHFIQITHDEGQDIMPDWGRSDEELFYLSARTGRYNLYRLSLEEGHPIGHPKRLTNLKEMGARYMDISADGQQAVIAVGAKLYTIELQNSEVMNEVIVRFSGDYQGYPVERITLSNKIEQYDISPNEKYMAMILHGEIALKLVDKKRKKTRVFDAPESRERLPRWLNDSTCLYLSDRSGKYEVYALTKGKGAKEDIFHAILHEHTRIFADKEADIMDMVLSPDKKRIALRIGRGRLLSYNISPTGKITHPVEIVNGWAIPSDIAWSPDSKWIAYALNDLTFNKDVYIRRADASSEPINVSMHPRMDRSPVWSPDGKKLYFLSDRHKKDYDVWFVWLRKQDWALRKEDWDMEEEKNIIYPTKDTSPVHVEVDVERIFDRQVQVTNLTGDEGNLMLSNDSRKLYFTSLSSPIEGKKQKRAWIEIQWDGKKAKTLKDDFKGNFLRLSKNGKKVFLLDKNRGFGMFDIAKKKLEAQPFTIRITVDHKKENKQIFEEAWRMLKAGFYDPEFHGQDFIALKHIYEPLALSCDAKEDFSYVINQMLGQLNTSHMGYYDKSKKKLQKENTGLLGVELEPVSQGLSVRYVMYNSPADRPPTSLQVGDVITAINKKKISSEENIYRLLSGKANERILLDILRGGTAKEIVLRPVSSLRQERYEAWVKRMQGLTDSLSNGRLGYIHIQGMNWSSFERFERELMASGYGKEGIVIDVRNNGGGWTTDMLMAVLHVEQHAYTIPRGATKTLKKHAKFDEYYPYSERLIFPPLMKPSIAICNESSYSNAEIFSHAYKNLGIGTLVGVPTFGAVISTGAYRLVDGSLVRMPFRAWYVKKTGLNMEGFPAVPDLIIKNPPDAKWTNHDLQLEASIKTLLKQIDQKNKGK